MTILGICVGHDASASLIIDGVIKICLEEEKISRKKSEFGYPRQAVDFIIKKFNLTPQEIDVIAIPDSLYDSMDKIEMTYRFTKNKWLHHFNKFNRVFRYFAKLPNGISPKNQYYFESLLKKEFKNAKIEYFSHHLSHAASAYYTCPFKNDFTITCDGRGQNDSMMIYDNRESKELRLAHHVDPTASIGQLYSVVTQHLGFIPNRHEGKVMGLSSLGKPTELSEKMKKLFSFESKFDIRRRPDENDLKQLKITRKKNIQLTTSLNKIGLRYAKSKLWLLDWLKNEAKDYSREDIAYAVQATTEYVFLKFLKHFIGDKKGIQLSLAGGVFANVKLNQKIANLEGIEQIYIHPAMSDLGLSLGAALLSSCHARYLSFDFKDAYQGYDFKEEVKELIQHLDPQKYKVVRPYNIYESIASHLKDNKIIGLFNGRNEWGPRALGNRSIIANPSNEKTAALLNHRLQRNDFMPFAPSILDVYATRYLTHYTNDDCPSKFMTTVFSVKEEAIKKITAAIHVDKTCRPHIVSRENNEHFFKIIEAFVKLTNVGAVLNTSFNSHEEPIVFEPKQAMKALDKKVVDFVNFGDVLISLK